MTEKELCWVDRDICFSSY